MKMKRTMAKYAAAAVTLAVAVSGGPAVGEMLEGEMLLYQKKESGVEPYPSRIIVTAGKMRLDDGVVLEYTVEG